MIGDSCSHCRGLGFANAFLASIEYCPGSRVVSIGLTQKVRRQV
jgi:hypothetical protein